MNQNSRYREYWRAQEAGIGTEGFRISEGALYRANEHAKTPDGAALVTVDELNRGPAVKSSGRPSSPLRLTSVLPRTTLR